MVYGAREVVEGTRRVTREHREAVEEADRATAEEERALKLLLLLHRLTLWAPRGAQGRGRRGPYGRTGQQGRLVADRIAAAWRGEWEELLAQARQRGGEVAQRRTAGRLEGEALAGTVAAHGQELAQLEGRMHSTQSELVALDFHGAEVGVSRVSEAAGASLAPHTPPTRSAT